MRIPIKHISVLGTVLAVRKHSIYSKKKKLDFERVVGVWNWDIWSVHLF